MGWHAVNLNLFYVELEYKVLGGDPLNSYVIRGRQGCTGLLIQVWGRGHFWADLGPRPVVWAFIKSSPNVNLISVKAGSLWVLIYLLVSPSLSTGQSNIFDREKWSIFDENFELFKFSVLNFPNFNFTLQVFVILLW